MSANHSKTKKKSSIGFVEGVRRSRPLYLLMIPSIIIFALFTYYPMYGIVIAFKNFTPADGIMGSSWAGLKYFKQYFNSYQFGLTIKNTIIISLYTIAVTFPLPVIMGLLVNQMKAQKFKKFFQVSTYLPHFISTVVMAGMLILFLSPSTGIIAKLVGLLGFKLPNLMGSAKAFPHIYVFPMVQYTDEDLSRITAIGTDIYKYVEAQYAHWVVDGGIDDEWDSYIDQLKAMGIDEFLQIQTDAYNAYKENLAK